MQESEIFVHLRVHTAFSLLEGAIKIPKLTDFCISNDMPAVAMTDTENLFGAMEFSSTCAEKGIKPIIGCQISVALPSEESSFIKKDDFISDIAPVILLVQNETGYQNLIKICSKSHLEITPHDVPHVSLEDLNTYNEGLILLSGGADGIIGKFIQDNKEQKAREILDYLVKSFPNRLYIELERHGLDKEARTEETFLKLAYEMNLPIVATNEAFFISEDMFEAHDALICIAEKTFVNTIERRRLTPEHRLKTSAEMIELFSDLPEAISNTVEIAKRCSFMVQGTKPALPHFTREEGQSEAALLRINAIEGLHKRLEAAVFTADMSKEEKEECAKPYFERLEYELGVIEKMQFPGYFLIVAEFIQWSKNHNIPVGPGRGSGAGSVVAWALTITDLNPLRFNLLFERFLNPERVSMPDFDVDFCQEKRSQTIEHVREKYGKDSVAQIITFGKLQAKAVIRDVGRVLEVPYPVVDRLSKLIPNDPGQKVTLKGTFESIPEFKKEVEKEEQTKRLFEIAVQLEGLYRNASTHAAGVVIGAKPLNQIVALYRDPDSDMPVTQFDMKWIEKTGLIKFDFLGLKTLTGIAKAVKLIKRYGTEVDIANVPLDDTKTYKLLQDADTAGVFQFESSGMRKILHDLQPDKLEDLVAIVALFRPGPMDNIPSYINRKHGTEEPDYLHPMLEGILKETYGIMIYQEQVMQIAQVMGGYSLGSADLLRRAMGKKKVEEMQKQRSIFVEGAKERGVNEDQAKNIFDQMEKFAGYGFNKSHAACYAFIAYQTAYLKANYPVEFMASVMTMEMQNTDKLAMFKRELAKMEIELLPPDINKAWPEFSVENGKIRYALGALKGVGDSAAKSIAEERTANGEFKSISDFLKRIDNHQVNKKCIETLIKAGAFDSLNSNRGLLFSNLDRLVQHSFAANEEKKSNQINLFEEIPEEQEIKLTPTTPWTMEEVLDNETASIGFFLSAHPLDAYNKALERLSVKSFATVSKIVARTFSTRAKMAGIVTSSVRERVSKSGNRYAFVSASDSSGSYDMICFSDVLGTARDILNSGKPLLFTVNAEKAVGEDSFRMNLQGVELLEKAITETSPEIRIVFTNESALPSIKQITDKLTSGHSKIILVPRLPDWDIRIELKGSYTLPPNLISELKQIDGIIEINEG